jgi:diguanylate cyclase (GGDEF)-like protein
LVVLDLRSESEPACDERLLALKGSAVTAVVPCVVLAHSSHVVALLGAGADEVLSHDISPEEGAARVDAALRRSSRDLAVQPTTRLPASVAIDAEIERRIASGERFAACYADLDHFKEFNDRYGFREGDRVIRMTARVLHDAALGLGGPGAFVGHIGGDDFMLVLALDRAAGVCELAIEVFDTLAPLQYSEADRRAGYYFGKDRRGQLHRVPLMTLSIGAATNERRTLRSVADVSRLASEMKSFAKAKPGSVYAVDRRVNDGPPSPAPTRSHLESAG